ncbi:hypothetical protein CAMRE0001_2315 [Campylobacter rectus RM3267]|uniref:Uncharacterized protein n=2 Tax=Campylobacter rectus TaxID=203 RepID=A0A6G5QQA5_CAMRE|nr:hypothetical protein [Campylobacter rectus]EEF12767.1 hypothetical protein CAMRE0001_2315 [Campylobacter rectus RM3267]QCD47801.1 hypothetical protein CRECT_2202 [Campylobacter rectus]RRD53223.1 hypothetical protein EII16_09365 [Campylobacter rectus]UEB48494.1 hypothetical protein LK437_04040 [Campylobacter rectus]
MVLKFDIAVKFSFKFKPGFDDLNPHRENFSVKSNGNLRRARLPHKVAKTVRDLAIDLNNFACVALPNLTAQKVKFRLAFPSFALV